jgi:hypothetical protein
MALQRDNKVKYEIDDTMTLQGSCWFAEKDYFMKHVGYLDDSPETYSTFAGDQLELGLKYWLGGGKVKVNKKTWYAHLFKNKKWYADKPVEKREKRKIKNVSGYEWSTKHWMNDEEPNMIYPFSWLVDKFWPIPGWPSDWKDSWGK